MKSDYETIKKKEWGEWESERGERGERGLNVEPTPISLSPLFPLSHSLYPPFEYY